MELFPFLCSGGGGVREPRRGGGGAAAQWSKQGGPSSRAPRAKSCTYYFTDFTRQVGFVYMYTTCSSSIAMVAVLGWLVAAA